MIDYHIDCIADEVARQDPGIEARRHAIRRDVAHAVRGVTGGGRQNRSSADKYATPAIHVNDNPLGVRRKGKA